MNYSVVIVAAGSGERMKLGYNKVFYQFKDGDMMIDKSIKLFKADKKCKQIIVVTNPENFSRICKHCYGSFVIVAGGKTRQESVFNGLTCVNQNYVYIHDGARPYVSNAALLRLNNALKLNPACLLAVKAVDTIKYVENQKVSETLNRENIYLAQTPQAFETNLLYNCYLKAKNDDYNATDDSQLVEKYSEESIMIVEGDYKNIKITNMEDIGG